MNKFCSLSFSLLLCFTGCKDFKNKLTRDYINQKNVVNKEDSEQKSFQIPSSNQKELMDMAKKYGVINLETLGMSLDLTTKYQAIDILKSRGYEFITQLGSDFVKNIMNNKKLKIFVFNPLLKDVKDKLNKSTVISVEDSKSFQKNKSKKKHGLCFR